MLTNKKGNILDWFFIPAILLMIAISFITAYIIIDTIDGSTIFAEEQIAQDAINTTKSTLLSLDSMMLFVIVGLSIFVFVSSAVVYNHPAYFISGVFLLMIAITVSGVLSNAFWTFTDSPAISATAALYPKLTFLMNNLPLYLLFMGMVSTIVMYISYQKQ